MSIVKEILSDLVQNLSIVQTKRTGKNRYTERPLLIEFHNASIAKLVQFYYV